MWSEIRVCCGQCAGTGRVALTGEYLATLIELAKQPGELSGADLARKMGVKNEAMCNRLAALEKHGLVTSRRHGRKRLFRAKALAGR